MRGDHWFTKVEQHRGRWRYRVGLGGETLDRPSFETREAAEEARRRQIEELSKKRKVDMAEALARFEAYKIERGNCQAAASRDAQRAATFFGRDEGPLPKIKPETGKALYVELRQRAIRYSDPDEGKVRHYSDAEHRACLAAAKRFCAFLVREKIWTENPLAHVEPVGRPKAGEESKVQLRRDETVLWLAEARRQAAEDHEFAPSALAATLCLIGALRVSEALNRQVRDLEDGARFLFVPKSKTRAGRRRVKTETIADLLLVQVERAKAVPQTGSVVRLSPPLFPDLSCYSVRRAVRRICKAAGVPVVTTHALRGTMASLAAEQGGVLGELATDLGHASEAITRRSYASPAAVAAGEQDRALARLGIAAPVTAPVTAPLQEEEAS